MGAWRFGARADDDHVDASPSLTTDEHLIKEARQSTKDAVVQQPAPALIYLFSVIFLAVVLVSFIYKARLSRLVFLLDYR